MVGLSVSTTITETSSLHRSYFSNDTMKKSKKEKNPFIYGREEKNPFIYGRVMATMAKLILYL
jgi:hypothetical protein